MTPRQAVEAECARRGKRAVVEGCADLLTETSLDASLVEVLGGPHARLVLVTRSGGPRPDQEYWLRVWAARGLLWAWDPCALPALVDALSDEHWRVREMAAKVVARHGLDDALPAVAALADDPVARVRAAAARAVRASVGEP